jgi:hypothetical protein
MLLYCKARQQHYDEVQGSRFYSEKGLGLNGEVDFEANSSTSARPKGNAQRVVCILQHAIPCNQHFHSFFMHLFHFPSTKVELDPALTAR